jgi:hypothetical protein
MSPENISKFIHDFTLQSHFNFISYSLRFLFISLTVGAKLNLIVSPSVSHSRRKLKLQLNHGLIVSHSLNHSFLDKQFLLDNNFWLIKRGKNKVV